MVLTLVVRGAGRDLFEAVLAVFGLDGRPIGTAHFLRADLHHGQTCAFTGQFVSREIILL
jgi:hypothetical protein